MEVWFMIWALLFFAVAGYVIGRLTQPKIKPLGTLQIDHSDPDMPYIFLLDYDLDYIATHKQATFDVKVENIISHE